MRQAQRDQTKRSSDPAGPPSVLITQQVMRAVAKKEREDQVELSLAEHKTRNAAIGVSRRVCTPSEVTPVSTEVEEVRHTSDQR